MTAESKTMHKADELHRQARKLLEGGSSFEAEERALRALRAARSAEDFDAMIPIVETLRAARRVRLERVLELGEVTILDESIDEEAVPQPGCYLVQPPLVGADARRLRLAGLDASVPLIAVCREPITRLGLCPIVSISPGTTLRVQVDPPEDLDDPGIAWVIDAMVQLGDWALTTMDPDLDPVKRVDAIVDYLTAIPEHDGLHEALQEACRIAAEAQREQEG